LFARAGAGLDTAKALALNGAVDEATARYEGLVKAEPENAAAWLQLGVLRHRMRQWAGALEAYGKAEEVFRLRGNLEGSTAVALRRSETLILTKDLARSEEDLRGVMEMARATKYEYLEAATLARLGTVAARGGKFGEAREIAGKVGAMARGVGYSQLQAQSYFDLGFAYHSQFKYGEALEAYLTSLRIAEEERLQRAAAAARLRVAEVLVRLKKGGEALEYLRAAEGYYRGTRDPQQLLAARITRVDALIAEGKNEEAWGEARASYEEAVKSGRLGEVAPVLLRVAHMAIVRGEYPIAFTIHQQVRKTFELLRQRSLYVRSLSNEMGLRISSGDFQTARKLRVEALQGISELGSDGATELMKLHERDASLAIAEGLGEEALGLVRELPMRAGVERARLETEALLLVGRVREAEGVVASAVRGMSPKEDIAVRTEMRCTLASAQVAMGQFAAGAETARGALTDGGADSHALVRLRCAMVLARALKGAKAPEAEAARAQARGSLELFTANWPDEFRRLFLNRQDIRRYFNEEK
jgi:tetratricopeptide (TPR) repeat protein